jgi:type VI secretion system protein ImpC
MSSVQQLGVSQATATAEISDLNRLFQETGFDKKDPFASKNDERKAAVAASVRTLAELALSGAATQKGDVLAYIQELIAALDKKLSQQLNSVMHHPDFTKLEGSWRGLHHLVFNSETGVDLKIRVMDVSKTDLRKSLRNYTGAAWDQSPIFKKIYEAEFGMPGGQPYGALIGDYEFDHSAPDVQLLRELSKTAAAAHAPFIAAAAPTLMGMDSWQELSDPRDITKIFDTPEYAAWKSLRDSEDSRFLGLAMPRFLSRLPYDPRNNPVDDFAFEEDVASAGHSGYVWSNAAYAMGTNITQSFKYYGWCSCIRGLESGGIVPNLPVHTFPTDDGGVDMKCPTEIAITDRREHELANNGLMPLSHYKNTDYACFFGAQSLQKPAKFEGKNGADATANANLSARLPYIFATSRFAHYLKCIVRDKIGSFKERHDMEEWLNDWIMNYVCDPSAGEKQKALRPLSGAQVEVQADPENPGYYKAQFYLRPHYQLEGVNISLRLVARLPKEKQG